MTAQHKDGYDFSAAVHAEMIEMAYGKAAVRRDDDELDAGADEGEDDTRPGPPVLLGPGWNH